MNADTSSSDLVHLAYRLLKQDSYYDKMDLFLRANVAAYEACDTFQQRRDALAVIVDELRKGASNPKSQRATKAWQERDYATIIAVAHLFTVFCGMPSPTSWIPSRFSRKKRKRPSASPNANARKSMSR